MQKSAPLPCTISCKFSLGKAAVTMKWEKHQITESTWNAPINAIPDAEDFSQSHGGFFSLNQRGMNAAVLYLAPSKHPVCSQLETTLDSIQNEQQQHHRERPPGKWLVFASSWEFEFWNPIFPSCLRLPHHQGIGNLSSERLALSGAAKSSPKDNHVA